jgi:hypothetical protein
VSTDHKVRFGHSDSERLLFSNFELAPDTYYLDAELNAGRFHGAARIYGRISELEELHQSLQRMSKNLSGKVEFENMEGQLSLRCSIGTLGAVHITASLTDYDNRTECAFETDPISLDLTIASLANVLASVSGRPRHEE